MTEDQRAELNAALAEFEADEAEQQAELGRTSQRILPAAASSSGPSPTVMDERVAPP